MKITINSGAYELGEAAGRLAAARLRKALDENGIARLVLATGNSQFETLEALLKENIDWGKIEIFHLDEYLGLPVTHKASFRKYLNDRFISHINCRRFYSIDTEADIGKLIDRLTSEIRKRPPDVGLIGIGVNTHIAFNDPPADFDTKESFIVVSLDEKCKLQQVSEGWFESLKDVPEKAISMTVWQIMQCKTIVSSVPHLAKAEAVYMTLSSKLTNMVPSTMLKMHPDLNLFLDVNSASKIVAF